MRFSDSGSQFSLSFVSGAALLASPTADEATVLAQFKVIFRRGFCLCPPFAAIATLANLGNAFISWRSNDGASMALRFLLADRPCPPSPLLFLLEEALTQSSHISDLAIHSRHHNPYQTTVVSQQRMHSIPIGCWPSEAFWQVYIAR